jgi:hypothetical protein
MMMDRKPNRTKVHDAMPNGPLDGLSSQPMASLTILYRALSVNATGIAWVCSRGPTSPRAAYTIDARPRGFAAALPFSAPAHPQSQPRPPHTRAARRPRTSWSCRRGGAGALSHELLITHPRGAGLALVVRAARHPSARAQGLCLSSGTCPLILIGWEREWEISTREGEGEGGGFTVLAPNCDRMLVIL